MPSFEENLLSATKLPHKKLETLGYHMVKTRSLSHLVLSPYRVVTDGRTDGQTDRIPIANTRSQQYLPVQLSRVKIAVCKRNSLFLYIIMLCRIICGIARQEFASAGAAALNV